jgi:hypothetical protein
MAPYRMDLFKRLQNDASTGANVLHGNIKRAPFENWSEWGAMPNTILILTVFYIVFILSGAAVFWRVRRKRPEKFGF